MSIPVLASAYRFGINPAWAPVNGFTSGGQTIIARLPTCQATPTWSDVWAGSDTGLTTPIYTRSLAAAAFTLAISSDSANDAPAGSGALVVQVQYLDANYYPQVWNATLNGQTAVTGAPTTCLRVNSVQVVSAGSGGANAGHIFAYDSSSALVSGVPSTPTKVYDIVPPGYNTDGLGCYTVPANASGPGFYALISHLSTGVTTGTATSYNAKIRIGIALYTGTPGAGTLLPFQWATIAGPGTATPNDDFRFDAPPQLTPGSEIRFQAASSTAGAEVIVVAELILASFSNNSPLP